MVRLLIITKWLAIIWGWACTVAMMISWVQAFQYLSHFRYGDLMTFWRDEGDFLFAFKVFMIASALAFLLYVAFVGFKNFNKMVRGDSP